MQERLKKFFSFTNFNQKKKPKLIIPKIKKSKIKQLRLRVPKYKMNLIIQNILSNKKNQNQII